jgi:hypothetical protein
MTHLDIEYSFCPDCGEVADAEQLKRNKLRMIEWKKCIDNEIEITESYHDTI